MLFFKSIFIFRLGPLVIEVQVKVKNARTPIKKDENVAMKKLEQVYKFSENLYFSLKYKSVCCIYFQQNYLKNLILTSLPSIFHCFLQKKKKQRGAANVSANEIRDAKISWAEWAKYA